MSGDAAKDVSKTCCEKQKDLLLRILNWFTRDPSNLREEGAFDTTELLQLLQCLGFQLEVLHHVKNVGQWSGGSDISLQLTCSRSKLTATMTLPSTIPCNCPSQEKLSEEQSFTPVDSVTRKFVADILNVLLFMSLKIDINENEKDASENTKQTWEVDPNITPPLSSSSPMPDICIRSEANSTTDAKLHQNIKQIQTLATSLLELLASKNTTFTKESNVTKKRVSDIKPVKPRPQEIVVPKPSTPMMYRAVSAKVETRWTKPDSPMLGSVIPTKKDTKSRIPGAAYVKPGLAKTQGFVKPKTAFSRK